jgi:hypothetical protein
VRARRCGLLQEGEGGMGELRPGRKQQGPSLARCQHGHAGELCLPDCCGAKRKKMVNSNGTIGTSKHELISTGSRDSI